MHPRSRRQRAPVAGHFEDRRCHPVNPGTVIFTRAASGTSYAEKILRLPDRPTTVFAATQMGAVAYRILADQMEGREPNSIRVELATTLIARESTAPPA